MFLKLSDQFKIRNNLDKSHIGTVLFNEDPRKLGRLKILIKGIYEGDHNKLPWVFQDPDSGLGSSKITSSFSIPEVGTEVAVFWKDQDIYHPFYKGAPRKEEALPPPLLEDYPHTYGFVDSNNQWGRINKLQKFLEFFRETGEFMKLDSSGSLTINLPSNIVINLGGSFYLTAANDITTQSTFLSCLATQGSQIGSSGGTFKMRAQNIDLTASSSYKLNSPSIDHNPGGSSPLDNSKFEQMQQQIQQMQQQMEALQSYIESMKNK